MRKLGISSRLKSFRRARSRQVGYFILGACLGVVLQRLLWTTVSRIPAVAPPPVPTTISDGVPATAEMATAAVRRAQGERIKLDAPQTNLSALVTAARRPRRSSSRKKILRHASDEVRMFEILSPFVHHTDAGLSAAAAATWFQDFAPQHVELFGPGPALDAALKPIAALKELKTHTVAGAAVDGGSHATSSSDNYVVMLAAICSSVDGLPRSDTVSFSRVLPTLLTFKWFALAHDSSYISRRTVDDFLSYHESSEARCFARPRAAVVGGGGAAKGADRTVWSSRPGFLLSQRAVAAVCPYMAQFQQHMDKSHDKEATFSELLAAAGVHCVAPDWDQANFVDLQSVHIAPDVLGNQALSAVEALRRGVFFAVRDAREMLLLRRSDRLGEIAALNEHVRRAHSMLQDMQRFMQEHPLLLASQVKAAMTADANTAVGSKHAATDSTWMSSDPSYQLSTGFGGAAAAHQRTAAFAKDVEKQLDVACQQLSKKETSLRCISMVSAFLRFRPTHGMEYVYNLLAKSSQVSANNARPMHEIVEMVRAVRPVRVLSVAEMDTHARVYVVLPLAASPAAAASLLLRRFMEMYEKLLAPPSGGSGQNVALVVVHFPDVAPPPAQRAVVAQQQKGQSSARALVSLYQSKYKTAVFRWVQATGKVLSVAAAVKSGLHEVTEEAVVLIADPTLGFGAQLLARCRLTARPGHQCYAPLVKDAAGKGQDKARPGEALCAYRGDILQSGWLPPDGLSSAAPAGLDALIGSLKQRLHIVQTADPSLTFLS